MIKEKDEGRKEGERLISLELRRSSITLFFYVSSLTPFSQSATLLEAEEENIVSYPAYDYSSFFFAKSLCRYKQTAVIFLCLFLPFVCLPFYKL